MFTITSSGKTKKLLLCALFTALIAAGAFIRIPVPLVPFTLQVLFTTLAGILLGEKWGTLSVICYVALGLLGLPVFTGGGGFSYVLQPTFGYLIGFCAGTFVTGRIAGRVSRPSGKRLFAAALWGLAPVYGLGTLYCWLIGRFYTGTDTGLWPLLLSCLLLPLPGDIALCAASAVLGKRLLPVMKKGGF